MLSGQIVGGEWARNVGERRHHEAVVDAQTGHGLRKVTEAIKRRTRIEAVWSARGIDPFVNGYLEVVDLRQVLDQGGVDHDPVAEHDFEVLDAGTAGNERDMTHHDRCVELVRGVLLHPRGEADRQVCGLNSAFVIELLGLRSDRFRTAACVGEDFVVTNQAGESRGATGQELG